MLAFLQYFNNNNSINCLANTFTTIKQGENEAYICPIHPADLQATVTNARDFEAAEFEVNHAQAVNLVINGSSNLNSKLKQLSDLINQKLEEYLADNHTIYQPPQ
ncbi:hypothetical protein G9A89_001181 [Geosiphon pyriformis]|nr:hypothetical protein G9A89_001181 [Geosiphon pyriformis]